jgi:hypothetical protein
MTQAHVWVQNRSRAEAIPVELSDVSLDAPLKVQVVEARKVWDYESITLGPNDDAVATLNARGTAGWETTGLAFVTGTSTKLLLKRPR